MTARPPETLYPRRYRPARVLCSRPLTPGATHVPLRPGAAPGPREGTADRTGIGDDETAALRDLEAYAARCEAGGRLPGSRSSDNGFGWRTSTGPIRARPGSRPPAGSPSAAASWTWPAAEIMALARPTGVGRAIRSCASGRASVASVPVLVGLRRILGVAD
jgi:hypothetical protein